MYKNVIGIHKCRMNNDRAVKLVYTYVSSRALKQAREVQRERRIAEVKAIDCFEVPKLKFDSGKQDHDVYGSLGHEPLTSIGVEAFVEDDHVHELNDAILGLSAIEHDVEEVPSTRATSHHLSGIDEAKLAVSDEEDDQEEDSSSDDGMDLTPKTRREVDEMLERQDKRSED
jgi:hypothetical protein